MLYYLTFCMLFSFSVGAMQQPVSTTLTILDRDGSTQHDFPITEFTRLFPSLTDSMQLDHQSNAAQYSLTDCPASFVTLENLNALYTYCQELEKPGAHATSAPSKNLTDLLYLGDYCGISPEVIKRLALYSFRTLPSSDWHPDLHTYAYSIEDLLNAGLITDIHEYVKEKDSEATFDLSRMHLGSLKGIEALAEQVIPQLNSRISHIKILLNNNVLETVDMDSLPFDKRINKIVLHDNYISTLLCSGSRYNNLEVDLRNNFLTEVPPISCHLLNMQGNPFSWARYARYFKSNLRHNNNYKSSFVTHLLGALPVTIFPYYATKNLNMNLLSVSALGASTFLPFLFLMRSIPKVDFQPKTVICDHGILTKDIYKQPHPEKEFTSIHIPPFTYVSALMFYLQETLRYCTWIIPFQYGVYVFLKEMSKASLS